METTDSYQQDVKTNRKKTHTHQGGILVVNA